MTVTMTEPINCTTSPAESTPKDWRVTPDGSVPVADVVKSAGVPHAAVDYAVRLGLVDVTAQHGQGRRRYIATSDGLLILAAAALALAAGVALVSMLRAMKATGAMVSANALTIPLNLQGRN